VSLRRNSTPKRSLRRTQADDTEKPTHRPLISTADRLRWRNGKAKFSNTFK
jgi:hypothetical protein